MSRRRSESVLSALGVSEPDERRYQQVLPLSGSPLDGVAAALGRTGRTALRPARAGCWPQGMVSFEAGRLHVLPLSQVVSAAIGREAAAAVRTRDRLDGLARSIEFLGAAGSRPGPGEVEDLGRLDGEVSAGGNALALLTALIESSKGDLLFLRPDTWADAPRVGDLARRRPRRRVGPSLAGDLPLPRPAPGAGGAAGPDGRGGGGAGHRRDADQAVRDQRDPRRTSRSRSGTPTSRGCWSGREPWSRRSPCSSSSTGSGPSPSRTRRGPASTSARSWCGSWRRAPRTSRSPAPWA